MRSKFSIIIIMAAVVFSTACFSTPSHAQQSKPKLSPIVLNKKTSDPLALQIAKKINPRYFNLKSSGINEFDHFAKFLSYGEKRFLIYNPTDLYFICSARGCPFIIYENVSGNKWKEIAYFYGHSLVYDKTSQNKKYPNIIVRTISKQGENLNIVFMWNGMEYKKIS